VIYDWKARRPYGRRLFPRDCFPAPSDDIPVIISVLNESCTPDRLAFQVAAQHKRLLAPAE
jgi:hypothetical protein